VGTLLVVLLGMLLLKFLTKSKLTGRGTMRRKLSSEKLLVHPKIKGISGKGLMLAVQLDSFEEVERTMKRCIESWGHYRLVFVQS